MVLVAEGSRDPLCWLAVASVLVFVGTRKISLVVKPACAILYPVMSHENSMSLVCGWKKKNKTSEGPR